MWGNSGVGTQLLRVSGGVDNLYERVYVDGSGRTGDSIPTDVADATEVCARLELGYANDQITTTVFRRCYFHYGYKGISGYYTFEMTDSVIEGNYIGYDCNGLNESKFTNCWFEANYYRDVNFHIGSFEFTNCWFNNGKSTKTTLFGTGIGVDTLVFTNCNFKANPTAPYIFGSNPSGSNMFNPALTRSGRIVFISPKFQPNTKMGYINNFYNSTGDFYNYIKILNAKETSCSFVCAYTVGSTSTYTTPNGLDGKYIVEDKGYLSEINVAFSNLLTAGSYNIAVRLNGSNILTQNGITASPYKRLVTPFEHMLQKGDVLTIGLGVSADAAPASGNVSVEVTICTGDIGQ